MDFKRIGRPPKYENAKQMQKDIEEYFKSLLDKEGVIWVRPPTVSGLAFHLGLSTRQLLRYEKDNENSEFCPIITRAKAICELFLEENAITNKSKNPLSLLSMNFGRTEVKKVDIEHKGDLMQAIKQGDSQLGIEEDDDEN